MTVCAMFASNDVIMGEFRRFVPPSRQHELDVELLSCLNAQLLGKAPALATMPLQELSRLEAKLEAAMHRVRATKVRSLLVQL